MARKTEATLEQQRINIKKQYRRGPRAAVLVPVQTAFSELELAVKKEAACHFKAADFSYTYIAQALNTTKSIVSHWFEDEEMQKRTLQVREDHTAGAVRLIKTYMIEAVETLMQIARTTFDEKIAKEILQDLLDRGGVTKVNKSESATVNVNKAEVDITDSHGLMEKLANADPQVQQKAAEHMEELMALTAEHTDADVTHA